MPQKSLFQSAVGLTTIEKKPKNEETRKLPMQRILRNKVEYVDIIWQDILMSDLHNLPEDKGI